MKQRWRLAAIAAGLVMVASACTNGASTAPSTAAGTPGASGAASPAPSTAVALTGSLTIWESYSSGGAELGALNKVLATVRAANPGLTVTVVDQPLSDIFNKWQTDVLAGGSSEDMFIAPNDNLYSQADAGALLNLTDRLTGKLDGFARVAVDGSKADIGDGKGPQFYMVPESLKAVALWYDATSITTPPTTTDGLLAAVQNKTIKLGLNQNADQLFGFSGSFGGTLMGPTGKCIADQGGFADAFKYFQALKAAGANYYTDGNALKQDFQTGKLNAVIDGPWQTADFTAAYKTLGHNLGVVSMPAGPTGAMADPFTGTDGWYINPHSKNIDLAVQFALQMVSAANEQIFTDEAGHVPAAPGVMINDPLVQGFADAAAAGLARPQTKQFGNYWTPFGAAVTSLLDKNSDATTTVANACKLMNTANGL
jgi:arabinogalactan oligomer / maltooligosaccharide transport system substrate-binding protein